MFLFVISVCALLASASAKPQAPAAASALQSTPIPIISQTEDINPDGSFQFSFETGNGIKLEESGYLKDAQNASDKIQVIQGSVNYTDSDGNPVFLKYIADENGFQPEGDHLPTAPPVPAAIADALKSLPAEPEPQAAELVPQVVPQPAVQPVPQADAQAEATTETQTPQ